MCMGSVCCVGTDKHAHAASANAADDVLVFGGAIRDTFSGVKPAPDGGFIAVGDT